MTSFMNGPFLYKHNEIGIMSFKKSIPLGSFLDRKIFVVLRGRNSLFEAGRCKVISLDSTFCIKNKLIVNL